MNSEIPNKIIKYLNENRDKDVWQSELAKKLKVSDPCIHYHIHGFKTDNEKGYRGGSLRNMVVISAMGHNKIIKLID